MITDEEDLADVVAHADHFIITVFRGLGKYDKAEAKTLELARTVAATMYRDRPVGIYVVAYNRRGATERMRHVENWQPGTATFGVKELLKDMLALGGEGDLSAYPVEAVADALRLKYLKVFASKIPFRNIKLTREGRKAAKQ